MRATKISAEPTSTAAMGRSTTTALQKRALCAIHVPRRPLTRRTSSYRFFFGRTYSTRL